MESLLILYHTGELLLCYLYLRRLDEHRVRPVHIAKTSLSKLH